MSSEPTLEQIVKDGWLRRYASGLPCYTQDLESTIELLATETLELRNRVNGLAFGPTIRTNAAPAAYSTDAHWVTNREMLDGSTVEPGRWFPEPVAHELERIAQFAIVGNYAAMQRAVVQYQHLMAASTIHPPAHYQIDTSTPGWNTRYVDAVAKEHGWTRAEAQGRIADGGAR